MARITRKVKRSRSRKVRRVSRKRKSRSRRVSRKRNSRKGGRKKRTKKRVSRKMKGGGRTEEQLTLVREKEKNPDWSPFSRPPPPRLPFLERHSRLFRWRRKKKREAKEKAAIAVRNDAILARKPVDSARVRAAHIAIMRENRERLEKNLPLLTRDEINKKYYIEGLTI